MKVENDFSQWLTANRFQIIAELSMYADDSPESLHDAVVIALKKGSCYMAHVAKVTVLSPAKFNHFKAGKLLVPAYLAQAALDKILSEGFTPDTEHAQKLVIGMLLTRRTVEEVEQVVMYFPDHWSEEYRLMMLGLAEKLGS
jgi:hypothetical protein